MQTTMWNQGNYCRNQSGDAKGIHHSMIISKRIDPTAYHHIQHHLEDFVVCI